MKKKINLLIITSILGLIALSIIQGYLINNTYKLKKDVFLEDTKRSIFRFGNDLQVVDSIYNKIGEHLLLKIFDYKTQRINKSELLNDIALVRDSVNKLFINEYQKEFKKRGITYDIKYQKRLKSLIILDSIKNDTLYYENQTAKSQFLLGESFEPKKEYGINNAQTETDFSKSYLNQGEMKTINFDIRLTTQDYLDINDWTRIVLRQMSGILALSILIFSIVLGLLYYAIKSLITQKKIADIKTDFVNNITHELKTPLATLTLATKMLKKDEVKQQQQLVDNTVNTIERQNKRLQKLIDQVLNNSLGYSEIQLHKETVTIENYINTILDDFLVSVKQKDVTINRHFSISKNTIQIDKFYITTALLNILENAVKYSGENIVINCFVDSKSELKISIQDNGIGISEQQQKQVFDKFFRAGNKEIHNVKGLGLGLFYTNQILKAHNGTINVKSKEGQGTTFTLNIPFN